FTFWRHRSSGSISHWTLIPVSCSNSPRRACWISDIGNLSVTTRSLAPACLRQLNVWALAGTAVPPWPRAARAEPPASPARNPRRDRCLAIVGLLVGVGASPGSAARRVVAGPRPGSRMRVDHRRGRFLVAMGARWLAGRPGGYYGPDGGKAMGTVIGLECPR